MIEIGLLNYLPYVKSLLHNIKLSHMTTDAQLLVYNEETQNDNNIW